MSRRRGRKLAVLLSMMSLLRGVVGNCYFPAAFQGEYVTQTSPSSPPSFTPPPNAAAAPVSYSSLSVLFDSIPAWGVCRRRIGNHVVLMDDTGGLTCYRCFKMVLRSPNVVQAHTAELGRCSVTEEGAVRDCPNDRDIAQGEAKEIILYRTKGFMGEPAVSPTYCPINGAYSFTYSLNDGTENTMECAEHTSEIADCPYGFGFDLSFKGCSFGSMDMSFHCLGDWEGANGERFVALMDTKAQAARSGRSGRFGAGAGADGEQESSRPRYRCALYSEDDETGEVRLSLSSDSTCTSNLRSASDGYETLTLHPRAPRPWPAEVIRPPPTSSGSKDGGPCTLPEWSQGKWEHVHVQDGSLILRDQRDFKTYTAKCVGRMDNNFVRTRRHHLGSAAGPGFHEADEYEEEEEEEEEEGRYLIYVRTHCGDEHYKCLWLKNRGTNALEFQIGLYTSSDHNESLCADDNFLDRTWVTQGRAEVTEPTPYPIIGEYTGVIPDTDGLCAKLYSDCNNPEIMFYTIFNCFNRSEVYEEREYRCLGQWEEDGLIYTYTERRDTIGHECFVGLVTVKGDIFLREAGTNCERGQEPLKYGMRLTQVSKCYGNRRHHQHRWRQHHRDRDRARGSGRPTTRRPARTKPSSATALPSWRERELNNEVAAGAAMAAAATGSALAVSAVLSLSALAAALWRRPCP